MNSKFKELIKSCNECILKCETAIKSCQNCQESCNKNSCSSKLTENCAIDCQALIDACQYCMHECNQALEYKLYETSKQEKALKNCVEACKDSIKRCQSSTSKVLDKSDSQGCEWPIDSLNKCIIACDECIEAFER